MEDFVLVGEVSRQQKKMNFSITGKGLYLTSSMLEKYFMENVVAKFNTDPRNVVINVKMFMSVARLQYNGHDTFDACGRIASKGDSLKSLVISINKVLNNVEGMGISIHVSAYETSNNLVEKSSMVAQ